LVVESLCGLGLVGRGPLWSELVWGEFAVGSVGPVLWGSGKELMQISRVCAGPVAVC